MGSCTSTPSKPQRKYSEASTPLALYQKNKPSYCLEFPYINSEISCLVKETWKRYLLCSNDGKTMVTLLDYFFSHLFQEHPELHGIFNIQDKSEFFVKLISWCINMKALLDKFNNEFIVSSPNFQSNYMADLAPVFAYGKVLAYKGLEIRHLPTIGICLIKSFKRFLVIEDLRDFFQENPHEKRTRLSQIVSSPKKVHARNSNQYRSSKALGEEKAQLKQDLFNKFTLQPGDELEDSGEGNRPSGELLNGQADDKGRRTTFSAPIKLFLFSRSLKNAWVSVFSGFCLIMFPIFVYQESEDPLTPEKKRERALRHQAGSDEDKDRDILIKQSRQTHSVDNWGTNRTLSITPEVSELIESEGLDEVSPIKSKSNDRLSSGIVNRRKQTGKKSVVEEPLNEESELIEEEEIQKTLNGSIKLAEKRNQESRKKSMEGSG